MTYIYIYIYMKEIYIYIYIYLMHLLYNHGMFILWIGDLKRLIGPHRGHPINYGLCDRNSSSSKLWL